MKSEEESQRLEIGKGRSGTVFRSTNSNGDDIAIKVFSGEDSLTKLVNYIFTGAPNSYSWNEDAIMCAHLRREILSTLVPYWFDSHVGMANSLGVRWNSGVKANEIQTEYVQGRHTALHHPFSRETEWELSDLVDNIMMPLQERLIESGFDGLVWQAGKGNPTALNNFMLGKEGNWIWIDAESGVPALFPLNPTALISFYLPSSFKHGRALFDDVDTTKLQTYVTRNQEDLERRIGGTRFNQLVSAVEQLGAHQNEWKSMSRANKGITFQLKKDKITQEQADWYSDHPFSWYGRESIRLTRKAAKKIAYEIPRDTIYKLLNFDYDRLIRNYARFVFSVKYRKEYIECYVTERIQQWVDRNHLQSDEANFLRRQLEHESTSPYLTDFLVLMGLKPAVKAVELFGLPSLYAVGAIDEATLAVGVAFGGTIYRTLYTSGRMVYDRIKPDATNKNPRLIALLVGLIPTVGNAAYPIQMIYSASSGSKELAEFLTYDIASRIGENIPILGGRDTRTEHFFNHIPDIIVRNRNRIQS